MKQISLSVAALALLSSCAAIIEGSSETIAVNTNPPAANCAFQREQDKQVVEIARLQTPGESTIKKTRKDITVVCSKPGFQDAKFINKSGIEPWFFGNILVGGLIGMGIDWGTGAYNSYEEQINLGMIPLPAAAPLAPEMVPVAPGAALQGLANPMAAYEGGQEPVRAPQPQQALVAPVAPAQTLSLPSATPAAPVAAAPQPVTPAPQHVLTLPATAPIASVPQAAPASAYAPQAAYAEPATLAPIVIPAGTAENAAGWGRGR